MTKNQIKRQKALDKLINDNKEWLNPKQQVEIRRYFDLMNDTSIEFTLDQIEIDHISGQPTSSVSRGPYLEYTFAIIKINKAWEGINTLRIRCYEDYKDRKRGYDED